MELKRHARSLPLDLLLELLRRMPLAREELAEGEQKNGSTGQSMRMLNVENSLKFTKHAEVK